MVSGSQGQQELIFFIESVKNNVKNVNSQQWLIVNNYSCESQKL